MTKTSVIGFQLFCFIICISLSAQTTNSSEDSRKSIDESITIHTDRDLYISGETVWFKILVFENSGQKLSTHSKVANLELVGPNNTSITRVKMEIHNGRGLGSITLPDNLNSHFYSIQAYTKAMRNLERPKFCTKSIVILNPSQPLVKSDYSQPEKNSHLGLIDKEFLPNVVNNLNIEIKTSGSNYTQRGLVQLEISTFDGNGQPKASELSISVRINSSTTNSSASIFKVFEKNSEPKLALGKKEYIEENEGMVLAGKVVNKASQKGSANTSVFLSFPGRTSLVYSSLTDSNGQFSFVLPKLYGIRQVILQVRPSQNEEYSITIDDEFISRPASNADLFILPMSLIPLANASLLNAQIELAYDAFKPSPEYIANNSFEKVPFFGRPDASYKLDDYTRFPLPEFFYEVVPEVRVRGTFGNERLILSNEWENSSSQWNPLLLVDGVPVFDQKKFLSINNKLIKSTDVVVSPFWLNPEIFDGIIQITSIEADARSFSLPESSIRQSFLCLLPQQHFKSPEYSNAKGSELPDFRNTLYWNPSVLTNENGKSKISFYTSDAIGEYEIIVHAVSESNIFGSEIKSIGVVKSVN